jgi:hypothetical protein
MSTLLSDLDSSPAVSKDGDLVDQILKEMNSGSPALSGSQQIPSNPGVISAPMPNNAMQAHIMDSGPATAHMIGGAQPTPADFAAAMQGVPYTSAQPVAQAQAYQPAAQVPTLRKRSIYQRITEEFKIPMMVAFLVFVFSLPVVNFLFAHYLPSMVLPTGQLKMLGLVIKSLSAGMVFWILQRVIVPLFSL